MHIIRPPNSNSKAFGGWGLIERWMDVQTLIQNDVRHKNY